MTQHGCFVDVWEFLVGLLKQLMPLPFILHLIWLGNIYRWKFRSNWGKKIKMGPSSALESWVSVADDPDESAVSTFVPCHGRAAGDAVLASIKEQKAFQCSCHEPWAMSIWFNFLKESSGKAKDFDPAPSWKINSGKLLAAVKKFFRREVLGWRGHMQIFETNSTKTFIHKLSIHGFSKIEGNSPIPASPDKLQALAAADSAFGKVHQSLCTWNNSQDIRVG